MYKKRFKAWGLKKYTKPDDVIAILRQKEDRDAVGKRSEFAINGRPINIDYLYDRLTRDVLLGARFFGGEPVRNPSEHIICRTPSPPPSLCPGGSVRVGRVLATRNVDEPSISFALSSLGGHCDGTMVGMTTYRGWKRKLRRPSGYHGPDTVWQRLTIAFGLRMTPSHRVAPPSSRWV